MKFFIFFIYTIFLKKKKITLNIFLYSKKKILLYYFLLLFFFSLKNVQTWVGPRVEILLVNFNSITTLGVKGVQLD